MGKTLLELRYQQPAPEFMLVSEGSLLEGESGWVLSTLVPLCSLDEVHVEIEIQANSPSGLPGT